MATFDRTRLTEPADEITQAKTLALRYRCEFVDLRDVRIDHDLFHSVPVDLMFRYNFVPIHAQNGNLDIALADPRNLNLIDELAVLLQTSFRSCAWHWRNAGQINRSSFTPIAGASSPARLIAGS